MKTLEHHRTSEYRKVANYVRAGEGLREALNALENAHRRLARLYRDPQHEYRETFDRAYEGVRDLYAAMDEEYSYQFGEPRGTLKKILRHEIPWPPEALTSGDDDG